jgi:hypothetical protein
MDSPAVFANLCLIGGTVTLPWRLREPLGGAGVLGRVLLIIGPAGQESAYLRQIGGLLACFFTL